MMCGKWEYSALVSTSSIVAIIVLVLPHLVGASLLHGVVIQEERPIVKQAAKKSVTQSASKNDSSLCEDATGNFFIDGVTGKKSCQWVQKRIENNKKDRCERRTGVDGQGKTVFNRCPDACSKVGLGPCAPLSATPTRRPSASPSAAPTDSSCKDATGNFFIDGVTGKKSCQWVQKRIENNKKDQCDRRTGVNGEGKTVFNRCPDTCSKVGLGPCSSASPFSSPSSSPSSSPLGSVPSSVPSAGPTSPAPSSVPSAGPSAVPSVGPSKAPSSAPSTLPSAGPSVTGSEVPSSVPSSVPTVGPSKAPSSAPSTLPSAGPSVAGSEVPSSVPSSVPSAGPLFIDISEKIADYSSDEFANVFTYVPWENFIAPMTFDINGDGFPDMLSHHHVDRSLLSGEVGRLWDLATSIVNMNNEVTYKAGKVDMIYSIITFDDESVSDVKNPCIRDFNLVNGSITNDYNCLYYSDFHQPVVLDFDRDGRLDALMTIGGASGAGGGTGLENMLFWGVDATPTNATKSKSDLHFSGGRSAFFEAGLSSGGPERTYGIYAADFNNDGYLDFFPSNRYRVADTKAPGFIYLSQGSSDPRHFDLHPEVSEFSVAALLTDFDQDGFANEFLILQATCQLTGGVCNTGDPRCVVYKWDALLLTFVEIWVSPPFKAGTNLISTTSGDFNGDGLTDVVILSTAKGKGTLQFWYSSTELQLLGTSTLVVDIPSDCKPRHSLRAADFDLDGTLELFITCFEGTGIIFKQSPSDGKWIPLDPAILGQVGDAEYMKASTQALYDRCFGNDLDQCEIDDAAFIDQLKEDQGKTGAEGEGIAKPKGQAVTVFDYNNDGFMDLLIINKFGLPVFFENKGVPGNKFISFQLKGTRGNLDGIGAIVLLTWNNGVGTEEKVQLWEHSCQSFESDDFGARESRIVFGLGKTGTPLKLEVHWPSGLLSTLTEEMLKDTTMSMNYNEIMTITEPE